jgi:hypothetical protein
MYPSVGLGTQQGCTLPKRGLTTAAFKAASSRCSFRVALHVLRAMQEQRGAGDASPPARRQCPICSNDPFVFRLVVHHTIRGCLRHSCEHVAL